MPSSLPPNDSDPDKDLWFLPAPPEDSAPTDPPWPMAEAKPVFDVGHWLKAESGLGRELARAAATIARLDERLRGPNSGLVERLALQEVAEQLWAQGNWIDPEKLALYRFLRLSTVQDAQYLSQADWAIRRMLSSQPFTTGLAHFLGRHETPLDGLEDIGKRPVGSEFGKIETRWFDLQHQAAAAHPLTRAAIGFFSWRALGVSDPGGVLEPMAAISGIGTAGHRGKLTFLPVGLGDKYIFAQGNSEHQRLQNWFDAVENGALRCLLHLDRLEEWQAQATRATRDLSGKTPPALIKAVLQAPLVSTDQITRMIGVSKVSAHRNLTLFTERGLLREVTGKSRYRFWTAKI